MIIEWRAEFHLDRSMNGVKVEDPRRFRLSDACWIGINLNRPSQKTICRKIRITKNIKTRTTGPDRH